MKKMFQRMAAEKVKCDIELKITSIVVDVHSPLILKLKWVRGPQVDISKTFEVNQHSNTYELDYTFHRSSSFYRRHSEWQRKECLIQLMYSTVGSEEETGEVTIDMAPFVGKGQIY